MGNEAYWKVIVTLQLEKKKTREEYLVNAISATDAEAKTNDRFEGMMSDIEITKVEKTKILEVL